MRTEPPARRAKTQPSGDDNMAMYARALGGRICDLPRDFLSLIARANLNAQPRYLDRQLRDIIWSQRLARRYSL